VLLAVDNAYPARRLCLCRSAAGLSGYTRIMVVLYVAKILMVGLSRILKIESKGTPLDDGGVCGRAGCMLCRENSDHARLIAPRAS
jgi:hypothetical protein